MMTVIVCDQKKINPFYADFIEDVGLEELCKRLALILQLCSLLATVS